jgi:hypothetical protein
VDRLHEVVPAILGALNKLTGAYIPNYTVREHKPKKKLRLSFRVLVAPTRRKSVIRALLRLASKLDVGMKIPGPPEYAAWIKADERSEHWNRERCEILHQISMAAMACLKEGVPGPSLASWDLLRRNYAHLFVNMLALREGFIDIAGEAGRHG